MHDGKVVIDEYNQEAQIVIIIIIIIVRNIHSKNSCHQASQRHLNLAVKQGTSSFAGRMTSV
jgi:hypothetical protein